jgi:hypothetical protein
MANGGTSTPMLAAVRLAAQVSYFMLPDIRWEAPCEKVEDLIQPICGASRPSARGVNSACFPPESPSPIPPEGE